MVHGQAILFLMILAALTGRINPACGFSFEDPAGPQFTETQKQAQREAGTRVAPLVENACKGGHIEGRITKFDFTNNRIEIPLSPGIAMPRHFNGSLNQRLIPFKSDGRFCAPLYALQRGGVHLTYKTPVLGIAPGRVWIPLTDRMLLDTIRQSQWRAAYGELGMLKVGDGISCVYSTAQALSLVNSRNLTMREIKVYVPKGGFNETGGEDGHLWTRCTLGPRPGTSQWQGGDGSRFNATHRGTMGAPAVKSIDGETVALDRPAEAFAETLAEWEDHQCAGWTITVNDTGSSGANN